MESYYLSTAGIRDVFHVYLNRFEFLVLRLHIIKTNKFCFPCITDVYLVLPNRPDDNL